MSSTEGPEGGDADRAVATRLGIFAFALSTVSALVYFSTSQGIRNFVAFLVQGAAKFARLAGLSG